MCNDIKILGKGDKWQVTRDSNLSKVKLESIGAGAETQNSVVWFLSWYLYQADISLGFFWKDTPHESLRNKSQRNSQNCPGFLCPLLLANQAWLSEFGFSLRSFAIPHSLRALEKRRSSLGLSSIEDPQRVEFKAADQRSKLAATRSHLCYWTRAANQPTGLDKVAALSEVHFGTTGLQMEWKIESLPIGSSWFKK